METKAKMPYEKWLLNVVTLLATEERFVDRDLLDHCYEAGQSPHTAAQGYKYLKSGVPLPQLTGNDIMQDHPEARFSRGEKVALFMKSAECPFQLAWSGFVLGSLMHQPPGAPKPTIHLAIHFEGHSQYHIPLIPEKWCVDADKLSAWLAELLKIDDAFQKLSDPTLQFALCMFADGKSPAETAGLIKNQLAQAFVGKMDDLPWDNRVRLKRETRIRYTGPLDETMPKNRVGTIKGSIYKPGREGQIGKGEIYIFHLDDDPERVCRCSPGDEIEPI